MYYDITARSANLQAGMGVALALLGFILDFVLESIYLNVYKLDFTSLCHSRVNELLRWLSLQSLAIAVQV
jgi:hypothetical protein